jgi:hypothetical protein
MAHLTAGLCTAWRGTTGANLAAVAPSLTRYQAAVLLWSLAVQQLVLAAQDRRSFTAAVDLLVARLEAGSPGEGQAPPPRPSSPPPPPPLPPPPPSPPPPQQQQQQQPQRQDAAPADPWVGAEGAEGAEGLDDDATGSAQAASLEPAVSLIAAEALALLLASPYRSVRLKAQARLRGPSSARPLGRQQGALQALHPGAARAPSPPLPAPPTHPSQLQVPSPPHPPLEPQSPHPQPAHIADRATGPEAPPDSSRGPGLRAGEVAMPEAVAPAESPLAATAVTSAATALTGAATAAGSAPAEAGGSSDGDGDGTDGSAGLGSVGLSPLAAELAAAWQRALRRRHPQQASVAAAAKELGYSPRLLRTHGSFPLALPSAVELPDAAPHPAVLLLAGRSDFAVNEVGQPLGPLFTTVQLLKVGWVGGGGCRGRRSTEAHPPPRPT